MLSFEEVRRGKRLIAKIATFETGQRCYFALRKHEQMWHPDKTSLSDSMRAGTAGWAIEGDMLRKFRTQGVEFAGVMVKRLGDAYMTPMEMFFTPGIARNVVIVKSREPYRLVPLSFFRLRRADFKI